MGQVPQTEYLIIGRGRMARHMIHYMNLCGVQPHQWHRGSKESLQSLIKKYNKILFLVSDDAIYELSKRIEPLKNQLLIHMSGALHFEHMISCHPLCTFGSELYTKEFYETIPFIVSHSYEGNPQVFPQLKNKELYLKPELRLKYHALCSMAANFSQILWIKLFNSFENELGLPKETAHPLLIKTCENLRNNPNSALTGPLIRGDKDLIEDHILSLNDDSFLPIYKSFAHNFSKLDV